MKMLEGAGSYNAVDGGGWVEHLRVRDLSCGTYSVPAGGEDAQLPHTEDELYICIAGRATLWTPAKTAEIVAGSVAYVPAGEEHRFIDVIEDLSLIVVFGPAELSRAGELGS